MHPEPISAVPDGRRLAPSARSADSVHRVHTSVTGVRGVHIPAPRATAQAESVRPMHTLDIRPDGSPSGLQVVCSRAHRIDTPVATEPRATAKMCTGRTPPGPGSMRAYASSSGRSGRREGRQTVEPHGAPGSLPTG